MPVSELASVDGVDLADRRGDDPAQGRRPVPRRRRLRGDPPLRRAALRARRAPRPARALGGGDRAAGRPRRARARDRRRCSAEFGRRRRAAAPDRHPRRAPDRRSPSRSPRTRETRRAWPRSTYSPTRDPQRRQVALLRGQHAGDPDRPGAAAPTRPLLVRPDGIVLEAPTSTIFWVVAEGGLRTPALDVGILDSITRDRDRARRSTSRRASSPVDDLRGAQRGVPRLDRPRGPGRLGDRRHASCRVPRARGRRRRARPSTRHSQARARRRRLGSSAVDFDLTDEQRLIRETAREFADKRDRPARPRERPRRALRPRARAASSARWATSARRSPRSTAAAASTTSATG